MLKKQMLEEQEGPTGWRWWAVVVQEEEVFLLVLTAPLLFFSIFLKSEDRVLFQGQE